MRQPPKKDTGPAATEPKHAEITSRSTNRIRPKAESASDSGIPAFINSRIRAQFHSRCAASGKLRRR